MGMRVRGERKRPEDHELPCVYMERPVCFRTCFSSRPGYSGARLPAVLCHAACQELSFLSSGVLGVLLGLSLTRKPMNY